MRPAGRRSRGMSLAEALVAGAILTITGAVFTQALAALSLADAKMLMAGQARRLLQYNLEQVRSGGALPTSGTQGSFTVTVTTGAAPVPTIDQTTVRNCGGCSTQGITTSGVPGLTQVTVKITAADGSGLGNGTTTTPQ